MELDDLHTQLVPESGAPFSERLCLRVPSAGDRIQPVYRPTVKHHTERIRHLERLAADLDRQIADAQELQKGHRSQTHGAQGSSEPPLDARMAASPAATPSRRARKHR